MKTLAHAIKTPPARQSAEKRLLALKQALEGSGLKVTHQRLEIYRELLEACDHPSAESVFLRVRDRVPTISLDTVYRTLATFESLGLVDRVQVSGDTGRFEPNPEPHHHLVCLRCGRIEDFAWDIPCLDALPEEARSFGELKDTNVVVRGVCRECLAERSAAV